MNFKELLLNGFVVPLFIILNLSPPHSVFAQGQIAEIKGKVVDQDDKTPIENATVKVLFLNGSENGDRFLTTDSEGSFIVNIDSVVSVRIIVNHPDYNQKKIRMNSSGTKIDEVTIELKSAIEAVVLSGKALDMNGEYPINDASIELISINKDVVQDRIKTETEIDGEFQLSFKINSNKTNELVLSLNHPDYLSIKSEVTFKPGEVHVIKAHKRSHYIRIAGEVIDKTNNKPIEFVTIQVLPGNENTTLERAIGTTTDIDGKFEFTFQFSVPFRLRFSHVSYKAEEILVNDPKFRRYNIEMLPEAISGEEIYVVSNIVSEDQLRNTGTVDKITNVEIQEIASMSAFDLVSTMREVDVSTQSINLQSISTRGFNSTANPRFLQLTDGIDNQAPGLGFPLGNLMGPSDLDIESMELLVGPSTTQYGSSAISGVLLTNSKDPFISQGFVVNAQTGMHNFKFGGADAWGVEGEGIYDISLRYAKEFWDNLAFKITGTLTAGTDWVANNYDNLGPRESWMSTDKDPGYNGVNVYGDENYSFLPVGFDVQGNPDGSFTPVTRTGYKEESLVDYDIATRKLSGSLHYKFHENSRFTVKGRYGYTNTLYTNDSRIRLENFEMFQFKSELTINNFNILGYSTSQKAGDSYNINILANELIIGAKSNSDWYRDFNIAYEQGLPIYNISPESVAQARKFADSGATLLSNSVADPRLVPGTQEFNQELERLKSIAGFYEGAGIRDNSRLYHLETKNNFDDIFNKVNITLGGSFRFYDMNSQGTILPDTTGNNITNYEYGAFIQLEKGFLREDLNAIAAFRLDKNENFDFKVSREIGINYNFREKHYFRFSYQNGFRYPTVREQFLNTNLGKARLIGGLSQINSIYNLPLNSFTEQAVNSFNDAVIRNLNSLTNDYNRTQAEILNLDILEAGILGENQLQSIKPEITNSIEMGYRQLVNERLYIDLNYFVSFYSNFIGVKRIVKPRTSPSTDLFSAAGQVNSVNENDRYYVYSNSESNVTAQGISFDIQYSSGNFMSSLNGTWSKLFKASDDPIIPGYNTPPFKINFEWGNRELITNVGFKMTFRARSAFDWQSSFLDGRIPSYGHFDFQFNIRLPSLSSKIKTGITNIGVLPYYDTYGGPAIGSILFTTFTFTPGSF